MSESNTVFITGASGKIGRCLVLRFCALGHTVVAVSRHSDKLAALKSEAASLKGRIEPLAIDLLADGAVGGVINELVKRGLSPSGLVNCARDLAHTRIGPAGAPTNAQWTNEFRLGVVVPFEIINAFADMAAGKLEAVVNIASMYGVVAPNLRLYDDPVHDSSIHYGVTKAALIHLTRELAVRLAPRGIRVNAISYGGVEGRADPAFVARYSALCPSGRMLTEDEVAGAVEFLLSRNAGGITGHNLLVDGGWTAW